MGRFAARTAAACGSQWLVHSFALPPGRRGEALRLPNYRAPALAAATAAPSALCFALAVPPTAVTCTCACTCDGPSPFDSPSILGQTVPAIKPPFASPAPAPSTPTAAAVTLTSSSSVIARPSTRQQAFTTSLTAKASAGSSRI